MSELTNLTISQARDLLAKGEATYQGRPQRVRWHD